MATVSLMSAVVAVRESFVPWVTETGPSAACSNGTAFSAMPADGIRHPTVPPSCLALLSSDVKSGGLYFRVDAEGQRLSSATLASTRSAKIRLLRGRTFTERDDLRAPGVVVVSRTMAERCWPGQDAIGKRLRIPLPGTPYDAALYATTRDSAWLTVIGVVGEARYR